MYIECFYENCFRFSFFFSFIKLQGFFRNIFIPIPGDVFNRLQKSVTCSFTKKASKFAIKRGSNPKHFLEVTKGIKRVSRTPQTNCIFQIRLRAILAIESLRTITTCFEHDNFHNNLEDSVYGQVYSYKYCRLLRKQESILYIFVGIISPPKILRN